MFKQVPNPTTKADIKKNTSETYIFAFPENDNNITWEETLQFSVPIKSGRVIKVYDGDSITIAAKLPFDDSTLYRFSVRLNGIDTPEIKGKNADEKEAAKLARDALSNLILNKNIILKNVDNEKYGRVLADVYLDELHINEWLIRERYAIRYDGGAKKSPESWLQYKQNGI
jgi:endonuclease YncB( thermonuclease family)